jgi:hypothetical protein
VNLARALIVVCGVLALSACGSRTSEHSADDSQAASLPSPPIEAIDEPSESWSGLEVDPDVATVKTSWSMCFDDEGTTSGGDCGASATVCFDDEGTTSGGGCDSPEAVEKLQRQKEEFLRAVTPAKGSEAHAIARLRLLDREPSSRALLVAWRSQAGALCLASAEETADGGTGSGPQGPCVPEPHCTKICLDLSQGGTGSKTRYVLVGVVASEADLLRMTLDDGRVVTYELSGPLVPGFREYRVFMLDLGRDLSTRLELLHGTTVIAEEKQPRDVIRSMRCFEEYPLDMPRNPEEVAKSRLAQCMEKAGSE